MPLTNMARHGSHKTFQWTGVLSCIYLPLSGGVVLAEFTLYFIDTLRTKQYAKYLSAVAKLDKISYPEHTLGAPIRSNLIRNALFSLV